MHTLYQTLYFTLNSNVFEVKYDKYYIKFKHLKFLIKQLYSFVLTSNKKRKFWSSTQPLQTILSKLNELCIELNV